MLRTKLLKEMFEAVNLTKKEIAVKLEISENQYHHITKNGDTKWSTVLRIADFLQVHPCEILDIPDTFNIYKSTKNQDKILVEQGSSGYSITNINNKIYDRIQLILEHNNISLGDMAAKSKIAKSTLYLQVSKKQFVLESIVKICVAYDVDIRWLVFGEASTRIQEPAMASEPEPQYGKCNECDKKDATINRLNQQIDILLSSLKNLTENR